MLVYAIVLSVLTPNLLSLALSQTESIKSDHTNSIAKPPNVVLILADDLGWKDLGCYGSDYYLTPNIDKLAREGCRFTQSYSACTVCSPTRAALLTGKYPARLHLTDWIPGRMPENPKLLVPNWTKNLAANEPTLADAFRSKKYVTASIGKWHLGEEQHSPEQHGFNVNIAGSVAGSPKTYFAPWNLSNLKPEGKPGEYLTDRLGKEAANFIAENKHQPFFLYFPAFAVHTPIEAPSNIIAEYRKRNKPGLQHSHATYAAMVDRLDSAVGHIIQALDDHHLLDRTIIVVTSDNGGLLPITNNKPLRAGKGSAYEGGVRVPLMIRYPDSVPAGLVVNTPVITMDIVPTLLELANIPLNPSGSSITGDIGRDGESLAPLFRGNTSVPRTELFWHYPHHQHYQQQGAMPYAAIRKGDYKLIEFLNDDRVELYNIAKDIGETTNLAATDKNRVRELLDRLHAWQKEVNAQLPTPNPDYDPSKPEHTPPKKNLPTSPKPMNGTE